ncbi:MAG: hypothetical protein MUE40_06670 [Anaerolineae bacterium]|jgi:aspartate/methionine/tyrosine aminotransferase|nr:hypothetical protein [Anaerolineae bacterium]
MNTPQTLSRPLAARVADLPAAPVFTDSASLSVPPAVQQRAAAAMQAGHTHYTDRPGILPLRTQVVERLGRQTGIELSADEVTITCGATEARFVTLKQLVPPGAAVLCAGDGAALAAAARLLGVVLTQDVAQPAPLVYLTPADDPAARAAVLAAAATAGAWIVWDLSAGPDDDTFHPAQNPALAARVITIGSLSRVLPGWRIGWLAGSQAANKLRAFKQSMTICSTSVAQWAALGLEDAE